MIFRRNLAALARRLSCLSQNGVVETGDPAADAVLQRIVGAVAAVGEHDPVVGSILTAAALSVRPRGATTDDLVDTMEAALDRARGQLDTPMEGA